MLNNLGIAVFPNLKNKLSAGSVRFINSFLPTVQEKCTRWKKYNEKMYEPQKEHEPRRPAYVCHVKEDIKYSYKKMWYVACFIRGMSIDEALKQLKYVKLKGATVAIETLLEAQKLAVQEHNVEFKTNLWVSESFVGKAQRIKGFRRCAFGRMAQVNYDYINYFVTLEEGSPPEYYYPHSRRKSGQELLQEWLEEMRKRKVIEGL